MSALACRTFGRKKGMMNSMSVTQMAGSSAETMAAWGPLYTRHPREKAMGELLSSKGFEGIASRRGFHSLFAAFEDGAISLWKKGLL
jgi:hypothetical protein